MNPEDIEALARGIAKTPLKKRIKLIEKLLEDLSECYEKKESKLYIT